MTIRGRADLGSCANIGERDQLRREAGEVARWARAQRLRTGVGDGARRGSGVAVGTGFEAGRGVAVGRGGVTAALRTVGVGAGTLARCGTGGGTLARATSTRGVLTGVLTCGSAPAPSPAAWAAPLSDAAASA